MQSQQGVIVDAEQTIIKIRRNVVSYSSIQKTDGATSVTVILRMCMSAWLLGGTICVHFPDFTILHHLEECLYISYGFVFLFFSLISYFCSSQGLLNQEKESAQGTYKEMVWKRREIFRSNKNVWTCPGWTLHFSKCNKPGFIPTLSMPFLVLGPTPFEMAE